VREYFGYVLELVYPTSCGGGCGRRGDVLCETCAASLVFLDGDKTCPICGRSIGNAIVCGSCLIDPHPFSKGVFGYSFEGPLREAIHAFKFKGRKAVGRALVRRLAHRLSLWAGTFDVLVPMPVTEKRLKERGFNQTFIIAEEISKLTSRPVEHGVLFKTRETLDQFSLSREGRRKNIKGAFSAVGGRDSMKGKRLLLVDDLYTTGSTAREACKTLLSLGPKEILFFALARTPG
jgi:ComF family protein